MSWKEIWNNRVSPKTKLYDYNGYLFKSDKEYVKFIEEITLDLNIRDNSTILDLGCGNGSFLNQVITNKKIKNSNIFGLDFCEENIRYACNNYKGEYILHDINNSLPFRDNYFDVILCISTLFYLNGPEQLNSLIREIKRIAKTKCLIFFGNCMDFNKKDLAIQLRKDSHSHQKISKHLYIKKDTIIDQFKSKKITITDLDDLNLDFYNGQKYKFNVLITDNEYKLVNVNDFKYIEHVDIEKVINIKNSIASSGILNNAITVDDSLKFVINGHHRISAFKMLNIDKIPAIDINYHNQLVTLAKNSKIKDKREILSNLNFGIQLPIQSCLHLINNIPISNYEKNINLNIKDLKTKVITFGVFDFMHIGHINLINKLPQYGDYIIVAVQMDEAVKKTKCQPINNQEIRYNSLLSLRNVDEVIFYKNIYTTIQSISVDILVSGEDQDNISFQQAIKYCHEHNIKHIRETRTPDISSSLIKNFHG